MLPLKTLLLASLSLFALVACGGGDGTGSTTATDGHNGLAGEAPGAGGDDPYVAERQHCVDGINAYRAQIGAPPLAVSAALEAFAAKAAAYDAENGSPHGYFAKTSGGNGTAFAENAAPGWSLRDLGSVEKVLDRSLAAMWAEGPGGGHYENMASTKYKEVGCGFAVTTDGKVWALQDFR